MASRVSVFVAPLSIFGCAIYAAVSGCAIVEKTDSNGGLTRSIVFGAPVVGPSDTGAPSVVRVAGLGLLVSNSAAKLGWFAESRIALDSECRIVLIGNSEDELKRFQEFMQPTKGICADSISDGALK